MARLIEERGRAAGVRTFLDEKDIEGGQSIPESIRRSLEDCNEFLVLLSQFSMNRQWVPMEIGAAWGLRKPIVCILDKLAPTDTPEAIRELKAVDLNSFEVYVDQLVKRAKGRER